MDRRRFLGIAAGSAAALLVSLDPIKVLAQGGPIRIGFLSPLTGAAAASGRELVDGWNLYWQHAGTENRWPRGAGDRRG